MSNTPLTLGAFGLGCVGQGFLELLDANGGSAARVKHVCVKDRERRRDLRNAQLTYDALDILEDDDVHAIVELTNDPRLALDVIRQALHSGRDAITASKKVVAENLEELITLQRGSGRVILYEASCAASIPVVRTLETHFAGEDIRRIAGILNGTSNYILTRTQERGLSVEEAVNQAKAAGFAEADPSSDLSGDDARYKLVILLAHAFGTVAKPRDILRHGIEGLTKEDRDFGRANGWGIRSIAEARRTEQGVVAHVLPTFVPRDDPFALVRHEYNAVLIEGAHSGTHVLQGKGAGRLPTGLAVLSDVQQLARGGGYTYARVDERAPRLAAGQDRIDVYARIPSTHQEVLTCFDRIDLIDGTPTSIRVTGRIALDELTRSLGDGREGFQVIALPHLSPDSDKR